MKYCIDYGTSVENKLFEGTLEEAMKVAEKGITYTQQSVLIMDEKERLVAILPWYDVAGAEGEPGFYGEWV